MKNIIVLGLDFGQNNLEIRDEKGEYGGNFKTLGEGIIKYIIYLLEREQKSLDYIFALTTENSQSCEWFRGVFPQIPMEFFTLEGALIKDNLPLATDIFGKITDYKNSSDEEIEINFGLSGDFRYNSIVLSLVELARYDDLNIRGIFYLNSAAPPAVIEEVSPFLNIPTIATGAEEFVFNGNTRKLRKFFSANEARDHLKNLLEKMTAFSDTLRICGSYEVTEKALTDLSDAVKNYELYLNLRLKKLLDKTTKLSEILKNCADSDTAEAVLKELADAVNEYKNPASIKETVDLNELYFTEFLSKIKREYQDVLTESTPIDIIRWCLKRGFLQQAVTFYAEWLPRYLKESGRLKVLNKSVIEDCKENSGAWSHWTNYLFRNYLPKGTLKPNVDQDDLNLHKELLQVYRSGEINKVLTALNGRNEKLESLLLYIRDFCENHTAETAPEAITKLPPDDMIRKLMQAIIPGKIKFERFVSSRIKNEKNVEQVLIKALAALPKNRIQYFYDCNEKTLPAANVWRKLKSRREVFDIMLKNKIIATTLNEDKLLNFVQSYDLIVKGLRNKIAHAVADSNTMENQDDIINIISESLDFIDD
ncbi:MAG: TM1812 family CRISPR-associated protein [Selenomonadaceae bacterium]|nr:TM1812 family CRISPR-associated protein [Selenomonadaceae bacterium]